MIILIIYKDFAHLRLDVSLGVQIANGVSVNQRSSPPVRRDIGIHHAEIRCMAVSFSYGPDSRSITDWSLSEIGNMVMMPQLSHSKHPFVSSRNKSLLTLPQAGHLTSNRFTFTPPIVIKYPMAAALEVPFRLPVLGTPLLYNRTYIRVNRNFHFFWEMQCIKCTFWC